jgi:hypothetical protein
LQTDLDVPQIQLGVPTLAEQRGQFAFGITFGVGQRSHDHQLLEAKSGDGDVDLEFTHPERRRDGGVGFLVHPLGPRRTLPHRDVIFLAEPLAQAEVGATALVLTHHDVHVSGQQQGRLARPFSLGGADRHPGHGRRGQGKQHHHPQKGEAQTRLLRPRLWPDRLILRGVGSGKRRAIATHNTITRDTAAAHDRNRCA